MEIKINGCNILEVYQDEHVAIPFTVQLKLALIILVNTQNLLLYSVRARQIIAFFVSSKIVSG